MPQKIPEVVYRPHVRLKPPSPFAVGAAFTNAVAISHLIAIPNCRGFIIRLLTATGGGTLAAQFVSPDSFHDDRAATVADVIGTVYTSNQPGTVAIVAGTENALIVSSYPAYNGTTLVPPAYNGESYVNIKFTPGANGTVTYCDFAQITGGI